MVLAVSGALSSKNTAGFCASENATELYFVYMLRCGESFSSKVCKLNAPCNISTQTNKRTERRKKPHIVVLSLCIQVSVSRFCTYLHTNQLKFITHKRVEFATLVYEQINRKSQGAGKRRFNYAQYHLMFSCSPNYWNFEFPFPSLLLTNICSQLPHYFLCGKNVFLLFATNFQLTLLTAIFFFETNFITLACRIIFRW